MAFRKNPVETNIDHMPGLTWRERRMLRNSWAAAFAEDIFPYIDEEPFAVLYSEKESRPNTPVNVLIGALLLKAYLHLTDDEVLEMAIFDLRFKTALHTTGYRDQPLSDKSLQRFRRRCAEYMEETGIDLVHDCMVTLAERIAEAMGVSGRLMRVDSMMIAANIRYLTRLQLLYTCNRNLVVQDEKLGLEISEQHRRYLDKADYNRTFYRSTAEAREKDLKVLLQDAVDLLAHPDEQHRATEAYALLQRCVEEQTTEDSETGERRLRARDDEAMHSGMLQNPADPDATYRKKAGKEHRGYVGNVVEATGENGSVIEDYQVKQNNYSDAAFMNDTLEGMEPASPEEPVTIVADGAYASKENNKLAEQKNVHLVTTDLTGKKPDPIFAEFELTEDGQSVTKCPAGYVPQRCSKPNRSGQMTLTFDRSQCANCPNREKCNAKLRKRVSNVSISQAKHERARFCEERNTEEFRNFARLRNGVETVPSMMRRVHGVDGMPCRGTIMTTIFFGFIVGAFNFAKLLTFRRGTGNYAENPVLSMG